LLFSATLVNAESNSELFNKAVAAYKGNDFEKAITLNESLIGKGCKTATIYFNLGNAYFKNGNIGKAMLNYERAERLAPNDEDIQHNLAFARLKTIDKVDPTKSFGAQAILKNTLSVLSSTSWCWISIALLWLTFGFALFFPVSKQP
jgi:tetratricopeptide (TPR) repeat protein